MKVTERLKVEHGVFLLQLRTLEDLLARNAPAVALAAAVETISRAEEHHSAIEERLLYPALAKAVGQEFPPLQQVAADHQSIKSLVERIRGGDVGHEPIRELINLLREHMEREIHDTFRVIEEALPEETLRAMCNWEVEHVFEAAGEEKTWIDRLGSQGSPPKDR